MIDYFETKSQPITRAMVWQAYKVVRANKGAAGVDKMDWQYLFNKWLEKNYAGNPFERYADDIVVHCKTEAQVIYMLGKITHRMQSCGLTLHPVKTKILNLRGKAGKTYPKGFDFLGFTIKPGGVVCKGGIKAMPGIYVSSKSKQKILAKFKDMELHKWRKPLEEIAHAINPVIRGIMAYYQKFYSGALRSVWWQLNKRLLKWAKWEQGLYKREAIKWLQTKYKEHPTLFVHWPLPYP